MNPKTHFRSLLAVIILCGTASLIGCGLSPESESAIKESIAANAGHVRDDKLPEEARLIALDSHDLGYAILFNVGSISEIPSDVRARSEARKKDGVR